MKSKIAAVITVFGFVFLLGLTAPKGETPSVSQFDVTQLETWCGEPSGTIRMVGAWINENKQLEDETGNLWEVGTELSEQAFYLLWIDDMGTKEIEDDEILKIWQERG